MNGVFVLKMEYIVQIQKLKFRIERVCNFIYTYNLDNVFSISDLN